VVPIPSPIGQNEALAPVLSAIHFWCALLMVALVLVHAGAALWHQFVRRDGTLDKML
jgi:cytochrome b561